MAIKGEARRSPADLFVFDSLVYGVRGDYIEATEDEMTLEELEVLGIDWEALRDDQVLASRDTNNARTEDWTSWIGRGGPLPNLNHVVVDPTTIPSTDEDICRIDEAARPGISELDDSSRCMAWQNALAVAQQLYPDVFF